MPFRASRPCLIPSCPKIAVRKGRCTEHARENDRVHKKPIEYQRLYASGVWANMRINQLRQQPFCQKCGTTWELEVHHIKDHKGDPAIFYDQNNLQTLCHSCHSTETSKKVRLTSW